MTSTKSIMRVSSLDASLHKHGITKKKLRVITCEEDDADPSVSFKSVVVRDYERAVGDNPSVTAGPPIGLGWSYHSESTTSLEQYEKLKASRPQKSRVLSRKDREELLIGEWDVPRSQIVEAIRNSIRIKNQRTRTVTTLQYARFELFMENCRDGVKKICCCSRSKNYFPQQEDIDKTRRKKETLEILLSSSSSSSRIYALSRGAPRELRQNNSTAQTNEMDQSRSSHKLLDLDSRPSSRSCSASSTEDRSLDSRSLKSHDLVPPDIPEDRSLDSRSIKSHDLGPPDIPEDRSLDSRSIKSHDLGPPDIPCPA